MGWQAGYNLPSASYGNIFIGGYRPGFNQTAGSRNLIFGYLRDLQSLTGDNQMDIMGIIIGKDVGETTGQTFSGGDIGIGILPVARFHLPAGAATAGKAPLKFTSGTNLTATEAGAVEYNGTSFFFSPSTTRLRLVLTDNSIPSNGQIPIGNGTNYTNAVLASADGSVTITNGAGTIDLSAGASSLRSVVISQFDATTTTIANVTGLTATLGAGKTYSFSAILYTTSDVAGGVKASMGGTVTFTDLIYEAETHHAASITAQTRATALGTTVGATTPVTVATIHITGTITTDGGGTLTVQFAANAANGTSSVLIGSTFVVNEIL